MIESATAADDDVVVAAKAAASEGVTSMTVRVTIIPNLKGSNREECSPLRLTTRSLYLARRDFGFIWNNIYISRGLLDVISAGDD